MKFTSVIDNITALKWELSIQEAYLFDWIFSLPSWANKVVVDNKDYYFASKNKAIQELPLLTDKVDTMYRYYKSLEKKELVLIVKIAGKDYVSLTEKAKQWNGNKSEHSENNPSKVGKKSEKHSEKNPTNKNTKKDNNTNNNNNKIDDVDGGFKTFEIAESIDYLKIDLEAINQVLRELNKIGIQTEYFCQTKDGVYQPTEKFESWYHELIEDCAMMAHNRNDYPRTLGDSKIHLMNTLRKRDFMKIKQRLMPANKPQLTHEPQYD